MKFYLPTLKHLVIQLAKLQIYTLNLTTTFWHCKKNPITFEQECTYKPYTVSMASPLFFNSSVKPRLNYFFHVGEFRWRYLLDRTRLLISSPHCGTDWNYLEKRNLMMRPVKHKRISGMGMIAFGNTIRIFRNERLHEPTLKCYEFHV